MVQWLRLCTPDARGQGPIPGQRTRSHVPQDSACRQMKDPAGSKEDQKSQLRPGTARKKKKKKKKLCKILNKQPYWGIKLTDNKLRIFKVYNLVCFRVHLHLQDYPHKKDIHYLQRVPPSCLLMSLFYIPPHLSPISRQPKHWSTFY